MPGPFQDRFLESCPLYAGPPSLLRGLLPALMLILLLHMLIPVTGMKDKGQ
jgi:hypothetical protein